MSAQSKLTLPATAVYDVVEIRHSAEEQKRLRLPTETAYWLTRSFRLPDAVDAKLLGSPGFERLALFDTDSEDRAFKEVLAMAVDPKNLAVVNAAVELTAGLRRSMGPVAREMLPSELAARLAALEVAVAALKGK